MIRKDWLLLLNNWRLIKRNYKRYDSYLHGKIGKLPSYSGRLMRFHHELNSLNIKEGLLNFTTKVDIIIFVPEKWMYLACFT